MPANQLSGSCATERFRIDGKLFERHAREGTQLFSVPKVSSSWPRFVLETAAVIAVLLCLGLAALWLVRHPILTDFDEVGYMNHTMSDAITLQSGAFGILRDSLFLWYRWQPPGLRLIGLPIAIVSWPMAPEALRISSAIMFLLTALVLWLALRLLAGRTGAAAGVLLYAVAPVNMVGAQNFMTEALLHLCAALSLWLLVAEARSPRVSALRMALLGLVLAFGMLTKLTFLPTWGVLWVGVAALGWWRHRNSTDLMLRLLLPMIGLLLFAWPHYALNGSRFIENARLASAGLGVTLWPEVGVPYAVRAVETLTAQVFGPGGAVVLLSAIALLPIAWRRADTSQRSMMVLAGLAALPTLFGFLFSSNHADRYVGLSVVALTLPVALSFGLALRGAPVAAPAPAALVALSGATALVQVALALVIIWSGSLQAWPLAGLNQVIARPNYNCDYSSLVSLVPATNTPVAIGVFGSNWAVNHETIAFPFLRAGRKTSAYDLGDGEGRNPDWKSIIEEASREHILVIPKDAPERFPENRLIPEFEPRLNAAGVRVVDKGEVQAGPSPWCSVRVLIPEPDTAIRPEWAPFRPEVHALP